MLQLRRLSLSRQSNPSIRTAGLLPKLERRHPPFLGDGEDKPDGAGLGIVERGDTGAILSSRNRASWISGLDTLLGGDPLKKGGDEATCVHVWSGAPYPPLCNFNIYTKSLD
ncbi:hypothetical protein HanRHA438_Chr17g0813981 [Helianthus annuus]|nr:hypothetical protein HanRHA438_Chr17g0813981 [Helianthus annuus]